MKVELRAKEYEGLPAASAIGMAVMEHSGIRETIDRSCQWDCDQRVLSPGMAVKALIGPMFNGIRRCPLYKLNLFYQTAPVDKIFGDDVTLKSLNDVALGRSLDTLFECDLERLFWDCATKICRQYSIDPDVLHMDSTNFSVYAMEPDESEDGAAVPAFSGHAKDRRNDLLQYTMQTVTNSSRVLMYLRPYSGNASDGKMDLDTIGAMKGRIDLSRNTIVADCKLVNGKIIDELCGIGAGFVSKVPANYGGKVRERVLGKVRISDMTACKGRNEGWLVSDLDETVDGKRFRFIVCRNQKAVDKSPRHIETKEKQTVQSALDRLCSKTFMCEADAKKAFEHTVGKYRKKTPYSAIAEYIPFETYDRSDRRGRPKKGEEPERRTEWIISATLTVDPSKLERMSEERGMSVLITNLPRTEKDEGNVRDGATAEKVLGLYLDEYKVEHTYRLMKSGMGVDRVFFQTPSRENAMMFVVGIATLIENVLDEVARRNDDRTTFRTVGEQLMGTIVAYDRSEDSMHMEGPPDRVDQTVRIMDRMDSDLELLLGHA